MTPPRRDEDRLAALLGALADGDGRLPATEQELADQLLPASPTAAAELASHRALVKDLRALPEPGTSPDWRMLEASIQRACAEVPVPRRWWTWPALLLPALGVSAVAMAGLALALWTRVPQPVTAMVDAAAPSPSEPALAVAAPTAMPAADDGALYLDDELLSSDEIDERQVGGLVEQIPAAAAITLGAADAEPDDSDELLPQPSFERDLDQLDGDALHALDQWLDQPHQKG
jgi:hypothetical protein